MTLRRILYRYAPFMTMLVVSCITPFNIDPGKTKESIVVQGMITNQPGPYEVDVLRTFALNEIILSPRAYTGAAVKIEDDQGTQEQLTEKSPGHFFTKTIQGAVGRTYTLTVSTNDGSVYKSMPEKLLPVGDFNIRYKFEMVEDSTANMQVSSTNGFRVFIDSEVLPEQEGRVWWRTTGTYHVLTVPQNIDARPPCAGNDFTPCTCCNCWVNEYFEKAVVSDLQFVSNYQTNNVEMAFIEVNRRTMYEKYHLEIQQLSASPTIYNFWKRISQQQDNSGSLFQTPSPPTGGNMIALDKGSMPMIGYFAASSVVTKSIEVSAANVPYRMFVIDEIDDSCISAFSNSSNKKPLFW